MIRVVEGQPGRESFRVVARDGDLMCRAIRPGRAVAGHEGLASPLRVELRNCARLDSVVKLVVGNSEGRN